MNESYLFDTQYHVLIWFQIIDVEVLMQVQVYDDWRDLQPLYNQRPGQFVL